jgi:hypothetical protein
MEFLSISLTKDLSLLHNNIHDTPTKRPASKGLDSKGPVTKGPATKSLGYERSGDERSGVLKVRQWKVRPQNIWQDYFDTKCPKYFIFVNISKRPILKLIQYFIYGKKSTKNAIDLP